MVTKMAAVTATPVKRIPSIWRRCRRVVIRYIVWSLLYLASAAYVTKILIVVSSSSSATFPVDRLPENIPVVNSTSSQNIIRTAEILNVSSPIRRPLPSPIPTPPSLIVHVTWFFPPGTTFRFHEALCLLAVQRFVRPRKIFFWYDGALPTGQWWQFARQSVAHLLLVPVTRPTSVFNKTVSVPEHQSDLVRLAVLDEHGGLYVDLDLILVRPLDALIDLVTQPLTSSPYSSAPRDFVVMGAENPDMLGSGFILSLRPAASFIRLWRQSYADGFVDTDWNRHSVFVPMELARSRPELVHIEWFTINRPNWDERDWLYTPGKLWDWSSNYAVHLWYRNRPANDVDYDPITIRTLNTTVGEVFRHIYYGHDRLLSAIT